MSVKSHTYKLTDEFVEECVIALAFYNSIDQIPIRENETKEEADKRMKDYILSKKDKYKQKFLENDRTANRKKQTATV